MVTGGLGLGASIYGMLRLDAFLPPRGLPHTPITSLDATVPFLSGIAGIPQATLMLVALVAIPILIVAGVTPRWMIRALIAAAIVALLVTASLSFAPPTGTDPMRVVLLVATVAVASWAIYEWGSLGAWTWIVAALVFQGLSGVREAVFAATAQERVAGLLSAVATGALITLIAWRTRIPGTAAAAV
jgi:hypothetical protein